NTYGVESASRKFFSKTTSDLELIEAATLVGSLKASHYYNPRVYPDRSEHRRNVVLHQMKKYGFLSAEDYDTASSTPLAIDYQFFNVSQGIAPYFREHLRKEVRKLLDTLNKPDGGLYNLYHDGL